MGKLTYKGLVPKDDPMFSTGPELFSRPESNESSMNTPSNTAGAMQERSSSATEQVDEKADGEFRIVKYLHRNPEKMHVALEKLRKKSTAFEANEAVCIFPKK